MKVLPRASRMALTPGLAVTGSVGPYPIFQGSPAIANGMVYIASQKKLGAFAVQGCGQATCQPVWRADARGCGQSICPYLYLDFAGGMVASIASSPAIANGVVYVGRKSAEVLAFKAIGCEQQSCGPIWSGDTRDQVVDGSPAIADGKLYIGSTDKFYPFSISGRLYVFDVPGTSSAG